MRKVTRFRLLRILKVKIKQSCCWFTNPNISDSTSVTRPAVNFDINEDSNFSTGDNFDSDSNQTFEPQNYQGGTTGSTDFSAMREAELASKQP